ncbi:hypothetical protein A3D72_04170 [Candidatus Uhrbacteria bacterium RIFCSPHIGHO2_02_FULL_57_19]|uniref:Uncharacterized protein n=1 Tax=Candidatus Uhrbacteria bacterium RIFCSPHIGHO2_02_FULL_57_19 TaxID=1802391 RepID=A0A1F7U4V7_9BACT|nr:MAG: hypothetical protein A3D72_04170 [Candidatus Uhrbacteria bacterium RIFCSPHIGHO2_02_FULL_57_19]
MGCAQKIVDVIRVDSDLLEFDGITLFDFFADCVERLLAVKIAEDTLAIFDWCDEMVVDLIGIVLRCLDRFYKPVQV